MQTNLRKVGGSVMMALPPAFLKELKIAPGSTVDVALLEGQLVVKPITKPKYKLADLLAKCDPKAKMPKEDKEWLDLNPVGNEIL
ncbi:MAG: AbrB/MazE/SpoVT family DNA-binding domain-containing protein [Polynucleobacter sp.]|nr:AbrB/MazE/SpoVT family DNA-binding domain-containing protein [Polynucleobacter sp.]MDZ4057672.1 AbrB/MazE/SpoVT family DNA-binding domain-containing protein [Polynucleobacter sp.]